MFVEIGIIGKKEKAICTSVDLAETFEKEHKHVLRDLRELGCSLEFRQSNYGPAVYTDGQGKTRPMEIMTRDGFTLLAMGYTGEKAMKFKEAYIRQFNAMERALQGKMIEREKGIAVRQALTKTLQQSNENIRMHNHAYSTYTNCIYKVLFGADAAQLRTKFGITKRDALRDYFSQEELSSIQSMEYLVSGLLDCGWDYSRIKEFIQNTNTKSLGV